MPFTAKLVSTVGIICLGSLQFGYHMAELNAPGAVLLCRADIPGELSYEDSLFGRNGFKPCVPLSSEEFGLVVSIFSIGGLLGSFYAGTLADSVGRRKTAVIHNAVFLCGSLLATLTNNYIGLLVGRFVSGIGAGLALVVTSLVINEIAPEDSKGFLGSMNQVLVNVGILLTQVLALWWNTTDDWRLLLLTGAVIAALNLVLVLVYVDESPMWLFNNGMAPQAFAVLHKLRGGEYATARNEVSSWRNSQADDSLLQSEGVATGSRASAGGVTLREYLLSPEYAPSRKVGTGILVLQQFCGINLIIFYGVQVLNGLFPESSTMINCLISVVNTVVTFALAPLVDKLGRKPLLLTLVSMMGISCVLLGYGIDYSHALPSVVGTFTYMTFFAVGLGPIPFLLVGEVTQPRAKAPAQSWGVTMNWVSTFIVGFCFPILNDLWIGAKVYYIFGAMCVVAFFFVRNNVPETKGCTSYEQVWRK